MFWFPSSTTLLAHGGAWFPESLCESVNEKEKKADILFATILHAKN